MRRLISDNVHKIIALLSLAAILMAVVLGCSVGSTAVYAATYSDVLTDLQTDENFNTADYPADSEDYSLSVIQIAESTDGELLIYVYQPYTGSDFDLTATSINISTTIGENNLNYKNYPLTLVSKKGVFQKYRVDNFTVKTGTVRYYDISSIYRTYYTAIDGAETGGNTTSELAIAVAQCWAAGEVNGETYYDMEETNVVTIESYAGYVRYWDGINLSFFTIDFENFDSHFIAFNCDYDIDELYEADISFYTQSVDYSNMTYTYGEIDSTYYDTPLTISNGESVSIKTIGILGIFSTTTYSWDRICTVSEFINNLDDADCDYDSDFINNISDKQWVLRFYETEFDFSTYINQPSIIESMSYTAVTDITILRLNFLCNGTTYNLGVVSNKTTGSDDPVNNGATGCKEINWKTILMILALVLIVIVCAPILPYVAQVIMWVIMLPFKLISAIVQAVKKSKSGSHKNE